VLLTMFLVFLAMILTGCSVIPAPSPSECAWVKPIYLSEAGIAALPKEDKIRVATHNLQFAEICK
jgi:hypothetical protein